MPILAVVGIRATGEREVLAFRVGDRENQPAWEDLLEDLTARGVKEVKLWVSDGGQAMLNAIKRKFADSQRQRCVIHKIENVLSYIPNKQREQVEPELKDIFIINVAKRHTRQLPPLWRNIRKSIQQPLPVCNGIWKHA